jgi:hypothetical protein
MIPSARLRMASVGHLSAANWYVVSVKTYKAGEARCIVREAVTEAEVINVVHANVTPNENIQFCKIGGATSFGIYYFDNIAVEAAATSAEVDDPFLVLGGAYGVLQLLATGNGTDTSALWSGSYADVDENPKDDAVTYRQRSAYANNDPITHHVRNPGDVATYPIATIAALDVCTYIYGLDAYFGAFVRLRRGAGAWNSPASFLVSNAIYSAQCYLWRVDPTDSQSWTESRVIECEAGTQPSDTQHGGRLTANYIDVLVTFQIAPTPQQRLVHYTLDENDPEQQIVDNNGLAVPPEELRANHWLQLVGGQAPTTKVFTDFLDDPSMVPIKAMRFTEPDQYSIGSASDDLLEAILGGITGRVL